MLSSDLASSESEEHNMIAPEEYQAMDIEGPPPLPLNLHDHKFKIALNWGFILLTSCIAPLVLYPTLHWAANLEDKICTCLAQLSGLNSACVKLIDFALSEPSPECG